MRVGKLLGLTRIRHYVDDWDLLYMMPRNKDLNGVAQSFKNICST